MTDPDALVDYVTHWSEGMLDLQGGNWGQMTQNIFVDYTAGYTTVPDDLESACITLASSLYHSRERDEGLKSEKLGDYSYTVAEGGTDPIDSGIRRALAPFMELLP